MHRTGRDSIAGEVVRFGQLQIQTRVVRADPKSGLPGKFRTYANLCIRAILP
jgi:hypothetical protein